MGGGGKLGRGRETQCSSQASDLLSARTQTQFQFSIPVPVPSSSSVAHASADPDPDPVSIAAAAGGFRLPGLVYLPAVINQRETNASLTREL